ncbi:unnamed protein product, partial [Hapterophycus canaliculatus]
DFQAPPKRVFKKDIPTVKRKVGRPRKLPVPPVEEERAASSAERKSASATVSASAEPPRRVAHSLASTVRKTRVAGVATEGAVAGQPESSMAMSGAHSRACSKTPSRAVPRDHP